MFIETPLARPSWLCGVHIDDEIMLPRRTTSVFLRGLRRFVKSCDLAGCGWLASLPSTI